MLFCFSNHHALHHVILPKLLVYFNLHHLLMSKRVSIASSWTFSNTTPQELYKYPKLIFTPSSTAPCLSSFLLLFNFQFLQYILFLFFCFLNESKMERFTGRRKQFYLIILSSTHLLQIPQPIKTISYIPNRSKSLSLQSDQILSTWSSKPSYTMRIGFSNPNNKKSPNSYIEVHKNDNRNYNCYAKTIPSN